MGRKDVIFQSHFVSGGTERCVGSEFIPQVISLPSFLYTWKYYDNYPLLKISFSLGFRGPWILPLKSKSLGWSPQRPNMEVLLLSTLPHSVVETMKPLHCIHITLPWSGETWALGSTGLMCAEWGMRLKKKRDLKKAGKRSEEKGSRVVVQLSPHFISDGLALPDTLLPIRRQIRSFLESSSFLSHEDPVTFPPVTSHTLRSSSKRGLGSKSICMNRFCTNALT